MSTQIWSDEDIAEVARLFGKDSEEHRLAVGHRPELFRRIHSALLGYTPESLIQRLSRVEDERQLDPVKAQGLLNELLRQQDIRRLTGRLRHAKAYQRFGREEDVLVTRQRRADERSQESLSMFGERTGADAPAAAYIGDGN